MNNEPSTQNNSKQTPTDGIWISKEELQILEEKLNSFTNFQRLSSIFVWIALAMTILHIFADIFFHAI